MSNSIGKAHLVRQEKDGRLYLTFKPQSRPGVRFYAPADTRATLGVKAKLSQRGHISGVEFVPPTWTKCKKKRAAHVIPWVPIVEDGEDLLRSEKWIEDWDGKQPETA